MSVTVEADVIRRMLYEGHLTGIDEGGHARALYGTCPDDGADASVHRVSRAGSRIVEVVLRCPSCGHDFTAVPEGMRLR